jgi:acyl-CoA-dependent ceramide synthase
MATMNGATEPFPSLYTRDQLRPMSAPMSTENKTTRRRKSSGLGQDINIGDTGAPAIATLDVKQPSSEMLKVSDFVQACCTPSDIL